ncbi:MAG: TRAP transporter substrate-binding protein [Geminicoccaceae bacterium]
MSRFALLAAAALASASILPSARTADAETLNLTVLGQPVGSGLIAQEKEAPFFANLAAETGLDVAVEYRPVDVAGIPDSDGLRVLKSGLFDIVSIRGPQVSRDEPTVLGLDLIGMNELRRRQGAYRGLLPDRGGPPQGQFNAKLLGLWPAGPQVIFCKPEIREPRRSSRAEGPVGDQSAAAFVDGLGATGVPMPFGEVQQSLARGVVDCAITGPASANSGGWPEATTTVLPIALQLAINGYAVNLDTWNGMAPEDQAKLQSAIEALSADIWAYSEELYEDAMRCNAGAEPCTHGKPYALKEAPVSDADLATVAAAVGEVSLPIWAEQCNAVNPGCEAAWREAVGTKLGL